ncbi:hypothetical protein ACFQ2Y_32590 [Streptomyces malaysiensis subsp. malaysiensis]
MTARPPSGQHPSDKGPGHPPAAPGAPTGPAAPAAPAVPSTFLPGRPRPWPEPRAAHPGPENTPAPAVRQDPASAESAGIESAPDRRATARVSYGSAPVPRAPRVDEEPHEERHEESGGTAAPSRVAGRPVAGGGEPAEPRDEAYDERGCGPRPRWGTTSGGGCWPGRTTTRTPCSAPTRCAAGCCSGPCARTPGR